MKRGLTVVFVAAVFFLLFFLGCSQVQEQQSECVSDANCTTPMEFLVQSNCPFSSTCIEGDCIVVCPIMSKEADPLANESWRFPCAKDEDCDCSERWNRTIQCVCHQGQCLSVEG